MKPDSYDSPTSAFVQKPAVARCRQHVAEVPEAALQPKRWGNSVQGNDDPRRYLCTMTKDGRCLTVVQATSADFAAVMRLLSEARFWHVSRGVDVWGEFDTRQIEHNIADDRVFLAKCNGAILGTVTLLENDPMVWGGDDGTALYIHRLASARTAAGRGVGAKILRWAQSFAKERGKRCLRLDTWNTNRKMRDYYERQGFQYMRDEYFPPDSPLPVDYRGSYKSLYELRFIDGSGGRD